MRSLPSVRLRMRLQLCNTARTSELCATEKNTSSDLIFLSRLLVCVSLYFLPGLAKKRV